MTMEYRQWQSGERPRTHLPYGRTEPLDTKLRGLYLDQTPHVDHEHDDLYYTKTQSDARFALSDHMHMVVAHQHDDRYTRLGHDHDDEYSGINHTHDLVPVHHHDTRYYQQPVIDSHLNNPNIHAAHPHPPQAHNHPRYELLIGHTHDIYALRTHGHSDFYTKSESDGRYARRTHGHSNYALVDHTHPDQGGGTVGDHNHDGRYAPRSHLHDGVYSPTSHLHDSRYYTQAYIDLNFALRNHSHSGTSGTVASSTLWTEARPTYPSRITSGTKSSFSVNLFAASPILSTQWLNPWSGAYNTSHPTIGSSAAATKFDAFLRNVNVRDITADRVYTDNLHADNSRTVAAGRQGVIEVYSALVPRIDYAVNAGVWIGDASHEWGRGYFKELYVGGRRITRSGTGGGSDVDKEDVYEWMKEILKVGNYLAIDHDDNDEEITLTTTTDPQYAPLNHGTHGGGGTTTMLPAHNHNELYYTQAFIRSNYYTATFIRNNYLTVTQADDRYLHEHDAVSGIVYATSAQSIGATNSAGDTDNASRGNHGHEHPADMHYTGGLVPIAGDLLNIAYDPETYTRIFDSQESVNTPGTNTRAGFNSSRSHLMSHLRGIDDYLSRIQMTSGGTISYYTQLPEQVSTRGFAGESDDISRGDHEHLHNPADHIRNGRLEIDGDRLNIDYDAVSYVESPVQNLTTSSRHLTSHLRGIDDAVGLLKSQLSTIDTDGDFTIPWTAVPSDIIPDANGARALGSGSKKWTDLYVNQTRADQVRTPDLYVRDIRKLAVSDNDITVRAPLDLDQNPIKDILTSDNSWSDFPAFTTHDDLDDVLPAGSLWLGNSGFDVRPVLTRILAFRTGIDLEIRPDDGGAIYIRIGDKVYEFRSYQSFGVGE